MCQTHDTFPRTIEHERSLFLRHDSDPRTMTQIKVRSEAQALTRFPIAVHSQMKISDSTYRFSFCDSCLLLEKLTRSRTNCNMEREQLGGPWFCALKFGCGAETGLCFHKRPTVVRMLRQNFIRATSSAFERHAFQWMCINCAFQHGTYPTLDEPCHAILRRECLQLLA